MKSLINEKNSSLFFLFKIRHYQTKDDYQEEDSGKNLKIIGKKPYSMRTDTAIITGQDTNTIIKRICRTFKSEKVILGKKTTCEKIANRKHYYNFNAIHACHYESPDSVHWVAVKQMVADPNSKCIFPEPKNNDSDGADKVWIRVQTGHEG